MFPIVSERVRSRWDFGKGEEIVPRLSAIRRLGGGSRYEAYLAWDRSRDERVVVKVVRPARTEDRATLRALRREAELLERLSHPSLVKGIGHRLGGPRPHLVLEHAEGPRLSTRVRREGPLSPAEARELARVLADVAAYMARERVAHLDIKPSNVILGPSPRVIDLSIARTHPACHRLTSHVGTHAYMAPEQCDPGRPVKPGAHSDVWGIGVTVHRALAGHRPFPAGRRDAADPRERWPQLSVSPGPLPPSVPAGLAEAIGACLQRDPRLRPEAAELADLLSPAPVA
jgi:eukaryotic-like serine/threonine-protein kinase